MVNFIKSVDGNLHDGNIKTGTVIDGGLQAKSAKRQTCRRKYTSSKVIL